MVRLLMTSVGMYASEDPLPRTVWEGRRFGPFGEVTWWGPTLVFVLASILGVERHFQMLKAPNYFLVVALLSLLVALPMCALRVWAVQTRPQKGRYRPSDELQKKLQRLGEVWLTDEPELNPKRVGSSFVFHESVAMDLTTDQLEAVCSSLRNSGWLQTAAKVLVVIDPSLLVWIFVVLPGKGELTQKVWIVGVLVVTVLLMTILKYRIPTMILSAESKIPKPQANHLADAMEAIYSLAGLEPDKFTTARIVNLRQLAESTQKS
ncbi:MAG: hypothetical protein QE269_07430 [Fimbriimonas sp.]|nr:hypothetical protein [Fimbriimonas sp.]